MGQHLLKKGEEHLVEINGGEDHEWGIDLAAGEAITLSMKANSTGNPMCTKWTWGFLSPNGVSLLEQPQKASDNGTWSDEMVSSGQPSEAAGPMAGKYLIRIIADKTDCPQLHYTLSAQ